MHVRTYTMLHLPILTHKLKQTNKNTIDSEADKELATVTGYREKFIYAE